MGRCQVLLKRVQLWCIEADELALPGRGNRSTWVKKRTESSRFDDGARTVLLECQAEARSGLVQAGVGAEEGGDELLTTSSKASFTALCHLCPPQPDLAAGTDDGEYVANLLPPTYCRQRIL